MVRSIIKWRRKIMIARKFVYGGAIALIVASSSLVVNAQSNNSSTQSNGLIAQVNQLAQRFEGIFNHLGVVAAQATPQPTPQSAAKPTVAPTAQPTVQPTAVPQAPYIGVQAEDTDKGITVRQVIAGSPADTAGLKVD